MLARIITALVAYGPWGVFLLALVDSVGVPLPATIDLLIIVIAVKAPARGYLAAALGVLGSAIGNMALFEMAHFGVRRFVRMAEEPGRFRTWFHRYGLLTVFIPAAMPIVPLPLKFFVISAGVLRVNEFRFLAVIVVARALRFFADALLGATLGIGAEEFLKRHIWLVVGIVIALAAGMLALVRWYERRSTLSRNGVRAGADRPKGPAGRRH